MASSNRYAYDSNRIKTLCVEMSGTQAWTVDNRLASVIKSDVTGTILATTTIAYDGDGVRVKKADPSGTTYYLGAVEVLITGTTQVTTSYYAFGGAMVAMRTTATATLTYLHGDHLGSVSLTTNASGQKVSEQPFDKLRAGCYKPYGEVRWVSGAGMPTDFTFTSQRAGPANYVCSLTDYVARFYSPALGRFVSADTIVPGAGNPAAFNRYSYVKNSPLSRVDMDGHCDSDGDSPSECVFRADSLSDDQNATVEKIKTLIAYARARGGSMAADHLEHWYRGSGETIRYQAAQFQKRPAVKNGVDAAVAEFRQRVETLVRNGTITPGQSHRRWETGFMFSQLADTDLFYAIGGMNIRLDADITVTPVGDGYDVFFAELTVILHDRYDWDAGKGTIIPVPGVGYMTDSEMATLNQPKGPAKAFSISVDPWQLTAPQHSGPIEIRRRCVLWICW